MEEIYDIAPVCLAARWWWRRALGMISDTLVSNKWAPLAAICLGTFMLLVDVTIVTVALPDMAAALDASFSGLQWVIDAYALALGALLLSAGSLADRVGRRRVYLGGLAVFTLASLACGLAPSSSVLIGARAVQGVGAAAMLAMTLALLSMTYRGADRGTAFGVWGATSAGRGGRRSAARRPAHPGALLAVDLLRQPADRGGHDRARPRGTARTARGRPRPAGRPRCSRSARDGRVHAGRRRRDRRARARPGSGMGRHVHAEPARGRGRRARGAS